MAKSTDVKAKSGTKALTGKTPEVTGVNPKPGYDKPTYVFPPARVKASTPKVTNPRIEYTTPQDGPDEPIRDVPQALNDLDNSLSILSATLASLEARLAPVLHGGGEPDYTEAPKFLGSQISARLQTHVYDIQALITRVQCLNDGVQL